MNPQESDRELISITEFNENFKGKRIQVLWPDTGKWYNADVIKVNVPKRTAKLYYVDSEEKEDINLYEAMLNMEVSWPYKEGKVGKTPASADKKRKQRDVSPSESESASEDVAPRDARAKKKTGAVTPKRAPPRRPPNAAAGPSDETRRVIVEKLKAVMLVASRELNETDAASAGEPKSFDPEDVADRVERAAYALFAKDVRKYTDKGRSLVFNLNHARNASLRARVLTGALQPEALVRMTGPELAPPDLQEMRREREARVGEDAFLAAGPATRLVKTSKGEALVVVGGGDIVEEGDGLGNRKEETLAQQAAARVASAARQTAGPLPGQGPAAAPNEGADAPRAPAAEDPAVPAPPALTTFEAFAADAASSDEDEEGAPVEDAGADARDDAGDDDEYDPTKGFDDVADAAAVDAPEQPPADADADASADASADADTSAEADAKPSPSREGTAKAHEGALSFDAPGTWTGTLHLSGLGRSRWRAAGVDGERASFESVLPRALEIRGRVQFQETNKFLGQVFEGRSKTRGVTVGVAAPEAAGDEFARKLTAAYREKKRYGLIKGGKRGADWELYLVPQGKLSAQLLKVFKSSNLDEAALAEKGASAMLWCVVHAKRLGPGARTKRQPSARSLNETAGFKSEAHEDEAGGTPPRTIPQVHQSTMPMDPYLPGNKQTAFAPYPQDAMPAPQYGAPPPAAFAVSVPPPPPPPRADRAEDFLNATFGAPPPGAAQTEVPPPPFTRVAELPPPPFAAPPYPLPPQDTRAGPWGFDRRDDRRGYRRDDRRDDRYDDRRDDRYDDRRFREDDRRLPPTRVSPSAGGDRGEPPRQICRDKGFMNAMQTHSTEQHGRPEGGKAFYRGADGRGAGGHISSSGGRGGRGGPFGGADDSSWGGLGRR